MRGDEHVVGLGGRGELPGLQDAADVTDVGLHDVGGLGLEELTELDPVVDPFPRRDRQVHLLGDLRQGLEVLRRHRLLQPCGPERGEFACEPHRGRGGEAAVHLHHQLGVRADGVPYRLDECDGLPRTLGVQLVVAVPERVDLQRPVAARHDLTRRRVVRLRGALGGVPAVRVRLHPVGHLPAEQLPDGHAEGLALDVPAGHLDDRDTGHDDLAGPPEVPVLHAPYEMLDRERVGTCDVVVLCLAEVADERVGVPEHPGLADTGQPLVGVDEHIGEIAPGRADDVCGDSRDAQGGCSPGTWTWTWTWTLAWWGSAVCLLVRDIEYRSVDRRDGRQRPAGV